MRNTRNVARPQPSLESQKWEWTRAYTKITQDVYVENPNREKPREPTDSKLSLYKKGKIRDSEAMTSSSVSSPTGGYNKVSLCISHTLSLPLSLCYNMNNNIQSDCPKSYLYLYKLRAIYKYSLNRLTRNIFTDMSLFRVSPGLLQFPNLFRFSPGPLYSPPDPIQRDRFSQQSPP